MVEEKTEKLSEQEIIHHIVGTTLGKGQSFTLWRMPDSDEKTLLISGVVSKADDFILEESVPGFVFAPFRPDKKKIFFPADQIFRFKNGALQEDILSPSPEYTKDIRERQSVLSRQQLHHLPYSNPPAGNYIQLVETGIHEIKQGKLEKIVPSQIKDVAVRAGLDVLRVFETLCANHPHAMVSLVSSPETGTWVGATPELLVSVDAQQKFKTHALAGTLPYTPATDLKSVAWTEKEIEEQALVSRYIISCFNKIKVQSYLEYGPRTIIAGNLLHLKTEYEVDMKAINFPQLGSVMLKLLHPTSAVCGMPLEQSLAFLQQHETHDREFYSGYLGPVNLRGESSIFVNLRCMQLFKDHARIYAGAGVTADSIPQKEQEEIEIKMKFLLNSLLH